MKLSVRTMLSIAIVSISWGQVANAGANAFYLSGKMGSSFVGLSEQNKETYRDFGRVVSKLNGGTSTKGVLSGGIAAGYDFYQEYDFPVRVEFEVAMRGKAASQDSLNVSYQLDLPTYDVNRTKDRIKNEVKLNTFMVNSYYDFKNNSLLTPYISLGLGVASIEQKTISKSQVVSLTGQNYQHRSGSQSKSVNNFAWSLGAGGQYAINENLSLDLSYRYLSAGSANKGGTTSMPKFKVNTSDIMFGLAYRF